MFGGLELPYVCGSSRRPLDRGRALLRARRRVHDERRAAVLRDCRCGRVRVFFLPVSFSLCLLRLSVSPPPPPPPPPPPFQTHLFTMTSTIEWSAMTCTAHFPCSSAAGSGPALTAVFPWDVASTRTRPWAGESVMVVALLSPSPSTETEQAPLLRSVRRV